jgi:hypothetical protein
MRLFSFTHAAKSAVASAAALTWISSTAAAVTVPFTEHFPANSANWFNASGASPLVWQTSGGPDTSSYAVGTFNFSALAGGAGLALLRAQDEYNSSGNAFAGNWITAGVAAFQAYVRHNTGVDLPYFVRFSGPGNFPGGIGFAAVAVPSGVWTQITIPIGPAAPLTYEGPSSYGSVFGNLGHIQIGIQVPDSLAGVDQDFSFDLDQAQVVPEPAAMALLLTGGIGLIRVRPRSRAG